MADFDENGNIIREATEAEHRDGKLEGRLEGPLAWAHIMYGLHALSAMSGILTSASVVGAFVFGWPSIIAVIINYATRANVRGTWLDTHWRWQLRSFWFAALWLTLAGLLALTFIGIPAAILVIVSTGLWVLYRVIRGWMALSAGRAMRLPPDPASP